MNALQQQLCKLIEELAPESVSLSSLPEHVGLHVLGMDSMTLIRLFVKLEDEFGLSVERLHDCLQTTCTIGALLALLAEYA